MQTATFMLFFMISSLIFQLILMHPMENMIREQEDEREGEAEDRLSVTSSSPAPLVVGLGNLSQQTTQELMLLQSQLECQEKERNSNHRSTAGQAVCNVTHDGISCWPTTAAGSEAVVSCFENLQGVKYDARYNATRTCFPNGSWAEKSVYDSCRAIPEEIPEESKWDAKEALIIYYIGYGLSLIALSLALWIFLYFKDLRCVRNTIHTNLMITYVLFDLTWIITATLHAQPSASLNHASCYTSIFMAYFIGTNFFWMFVEGFYLYILVVKTFSIELVNLHKYYLIGYGVPAVVVAIWAPIKWNFGTISQELSCVYQDKDDYDYIFAVPLCIVLAVNIFFLSKIMYVLITKLRSATTAESQQYRKAAKALLVLIPLLGITYLLIITTPEQRMAKIIFTYLQAALFSTQGFSVAVLYCFMNGEVRQSVGHHFNRWKTVRTLRGGEYPVTPRTYAFRSTRYGEGMKLYRARGDNKRGSSVSFSTSTTGVLPNGHAKKSIGSDSAASRASRGYAVVRRADDMVF